MAQEIIKIAYADDHTLIRSGISSFLSFFGELNVVLQADNGKDLIGKLEHAAELPDICMLDINMPEMDGFDTILAIKKKWPQIRILVLTIFNIDLYIIRMISFGAGGYMLKSSDPEDIKQAFIAIHNTGYYYSDAATNRLMDQVRNKEREMPVITPQEKAFLKYACSEKTDREVADALYVTTDTVDAYRAKLYEKFEMSSRANLAILAMQLGITSIEKS